jgi:hypothetical protein
MLPECFKRSWLSRSPSATRLSASSNLGEKETLGFASLPHGRFAFIGAFFEISLPELSGGGQANRIKHSLPFSVKRHFDGIGILCVCLGVLYG